MRKFLGNIALVAALSLGVNAFAQDKPAAGVTDAKPAASVPAEVAKPAPAPTPSAAPVEAAKPKVDKGDTAWMLLATVLVILMTIPGLALFYAGMVRSKNVLSVLMQVFVCFCVIAVLWVVYGY